MATDVAKILIVDDEARNLDALEVMLESSGCTLVRAQSADEALLAMLRHEFAAIVGRAAPDVPVRVLAPGESIDLPAH